ncbi:GNAT family N-acetyltransferase [Paenibacillus algorifonticola]|uniref:GNAT family N-acetyltransferase n=1 Tax=Paenibacillus algorifonticola TaxID=684063 RepID=UPI003D27B6A9
MKIEIDTLSIEDMMEFSVFYSEAFQVESDVKLMESHFPNVHSNPDYLLLTARVAGKIKGYVMAVVIRDFVGDTRPLMTLWSVCVHPDARRLGIGQSMLEYVERVAKKEDCEFISFITGQHRTSAHEFYRSMGYDLVRDKAGIKFL